MQEEVTRGAVTLIVDGAKLSEQVFEKAVKKFLGGDITYPYTVPEGCFWAMGDNRRNSADSRVFGPVSADSVTGHAIFRYWPIFRSTSDGLELAIGPLD